MSEAEKRRRAEQEESEGLSNPLSLDLIQTWYILGGAQSPPTLSELLTLPAWLLRDVRYFFTQLGEARDRLETKAASAAFLNENRKVHDDTTPARRKRNRG